MTRFLVWVNNGSLSVDFDRVRFLSTVSTEDLRDCKTAQFIPVYISRVSLWCNKTVQMDFFFLLYCSILNWLSSNPFPCWLARLTRTVRFGRGPIRYFQVQVGSSSQNLFHHPGVFPIQLCLLWCPINCRSERGKVRKCLFALERQNFIVFVIFQPQNTRNGTFELLRK